MLHEKVEKFLVRQVEREAYASNLYLSMATWAEREGFPGISSWMYEQSKEEYEHMVSFMKYINGRGGKAVIPAIPQPPVEFASVKEIFEKSLEHERFISGSINEIVEVALENKDYSSHTWLQGFVTEQIEEEASVSEILDRLNILDGHNLYTFDRDILSFR